MSSNQITSITTPSAPSLPIELQARLQSCPTLPSLPTAVMQVISLAREPQTSLLDLARSLEQDPALTLRLLSLANSVFSAHAKPTETCMDAVSRLGIDATLSVALGFGLVHNSRLRQDTSLDLTRFWQRALVGALAGHRLAKTSGHLNAGSIFTIALLQDIGMLALYAVEPELYRDLPFEIDDHAALIRHETKRLGCDHAQVGAWLGGQWGLPSRLIEGIANSHGSLADSSGANQYAVAAGLVADAWLAANPAAPLADLVPRLLLHLDIEGAQLREVIGELQRELPSLARLFEITQPPDFDAEKLLLEAKQLLYAHNIRLNEQLLKQREELEVLRQQHLQLDERIRLDPLTGLYNRAYLEQLLDHHFYLAKQDNAPLSVIFIDLDHFKRLNDRYGHRLGDDVLKRFAELLRSLLSKQVLGGRYGGEEFLLILPGATSQEAERIARHLCKRMAATPMAQVEGQDIFVSASLGIAQMDEDHFENVRDLIHTADQGMYLAKRGGRARISHCRKANQR